MKLTKQALVASIFKVLDQRVVKPGLPHRIGHLVLDFDSYIKQRLLQGRTRKPIYIVGDSKPCNRSVLDYWRKYLHVVEGKWAERLGWLLKIPGIVDDLEHDYAYTLEGASPCFAIEAAWKERPPLFKLTDDHVRRGEECLRSLGVPAGAWFVCVHAREGGYSPSDENHHAYRNVEIESYIPAMEEIIRRGGWCIRLGDATMQPLNPSDRVIDYAHSALKSDWMDVFLCARCRFFLGSSSGLFLISSAFGVPSALTNVAPIGCSYSFFRKDISIPKIYESAEKIPIAFPILFASPVADFRWNYLLEGSDVVLKANSSKETLDLTCEMLDRLDGTYTPDPESERRQTAFRALFHEQNYSWASCARIGDAFLRDHEKLLEDVPSPPNRYDAITWSDGPLRNPAAGTRRRGKPSRVVG